MAPHKKINGRIMTHKTKGIVVRTTKYGETSLIVVIYTALFGIQTYIVNGVRSSKKTSTKANHFQPAAILDLVVHHQENKTIHRIKESGWSILYQHVLSNVVKNCIALYITELLHKCLKQPEKQQALYDFVEDVLLYLDIADMATAANLPLYFTVHLPQFFGFNMQDNEGALHQIIDLKEGYFVAEIPQHTHYLQGANALITAQLLKTMHPADLNQIKLNQSTRRYLLQRYHEYYALHVSEFGQIKTLSVLYEVL
jgi:DNA repair protein RecO (recombination protein O)